MSALTPLLVTADEDEPPLIPLSPERKAELQAWLVKALVSVPMPLATEEIDGGTVRYLLKRERERRQERMDKDGLRRRSRPVRVCALSICDAILVKGANEAWHDYLHRQVCCVEHRDLRRTELAAIRRRAIAEEEG